VEHESAKTLTRRLERTKPRDSKYLATFDEMFPKIRRAGMNLEGLGKKLTARKIKLAP
jgi:hypothetical protein